jgi:hypothetical protein
MLSIWPVSPHSYIANLVIWMQLVLVAVTAFFLLVEYINTHQIHHLLWAGAFILVFVIFHRVTLQSTYGVGDDALTIGFTAFISGAISAGMIYAVLGREKKVLGRISIAMLYMIIVIVMSTLIGLLSISQVRNYWFPEKLDMTYVYLLATIWQFISIGVIIGFPIYTTKIKKETSNAALLMTVGGVLMALTEILLLLIMTESPYTPNTETIAPFLVYFVFLTYALYIFGMLYEKKWRFEIPGIEFED